MPMNLLDNCGSEVPLDTYPVQEMLYTDHGTVFIEGPLAAERLRQMEFAETMNIFRPAPQQKKALVLLAGDPDGMVFTARFGNMVIGYVTFHDPDFPCWKNTGLEELVELGGLEIAPQWRGCGITSAFLNSLFGSGSFNYFEKKIVMNIQMVSCWDLEYFGRSAWQYRKLMKTMLERFGFRVERTDDPEVSEHPANMLMVRMGKDVSRESCELFQELCLSRRRSMPPLI